LVLPKSLAILSESSLSGCTQLATLDFEADSQLKQIHTCAFSSCASLRSLTFPEKVEFLGKSIVAGCWKLASITFSSGSSLRQIRLGWPDWNIFEVIGFESMALGLYLEDFQIVGDSDDEVLTVYRSQMFSE
jgi:hypothetical protein